MINKWFIENKVAILVVGTLLLCLVMGGAVYMVFGHRFINAIYEGRSIGILNRVIGGQATHPIEHYYNICDKLFFVICVLCPVFIITNWLLFKKDIANKDALGILIFVSAAIATFFVIWRISFKLYSGICFSWNFARLAPTFAITHGYQLYPPANSGVVTGNVYGPIDAIAYLPVTIFHSPVQAVFFGGLLSVCFTFLPVLFMHIHGLGFRGKLFTLIGFLFFCYSALFMPSLFYSLFFIHADAPALGLGAIACAVLYCHKHAEREVNLLTLFIIAMFASLAFWSKQTMLPIYIALPIYILFAHGRKCFVRSILCFFTSNILLLILWLKIFVPKDILYNMITIPRNHPIWHKSSVTINMKIDQLQGVISRLGTECFCLLIFVLISMLGLCFLRSRNEAKVEKHAYVQHRWLMFIVVALFMIPSAILGASKYGGDVNAFSFVTYFLATGSSLALVEVMSRLSLRKDRRPLMIVVLLTFMYILLCFVKMDRNILFLSDEKLAARRMNIQSALTYAKAHEGQIYFPGFPLLHLMSGGAYYHFSNGILDREIAGFPVTDKHFLEHIPKDLHSIAVYEVDNGENAKYVLKYLPQFAKETEINELPGWKVYTKKE